MPMWPDRRLLNLFRIEHPILQAPMAGAMDAVVEELKPDVVSFHFGLPDADLVKRQKTSGRKVILLRHNRCRSSVSRKGRL